jgi:hypothetical protein
VNLSPEERRSVESISKGLCKAASTADLISVGVPRNLKHDIIHKDSLNRLTDAIKLYRENRDLGSVFVKTQAMKSLPKSEMSGGEEEGE